MQRRRGPGRADELPPDWRASRGPQSGNSAKQDPAQNTDHPRGGLDPAKQCHHAPRERLINEMAVATVAQGLAFTLRLCGFPAPRATLGLAPRTAASDHPQCKGDPGLHARCWGAEVKRTPRLTLRVHDWLGGHWGHDPLQTSRKHKLHRDTCTERPAGGGGTSRTSKLAGKRGVCLRATPHVEPADLGSTLMSPPTTRLVLANPVATPSLSFLISHDGDDQTSPLVREQGERGSSRRLSVRPAVERSPA